MSDRENNPGFHIKDWRSYSSSANSSQGSDARPRVRLAIPRNWEDILARSLDRVRPRQRLKLSMLRGWQEHGWQFDGKRYTGEYRVGNRSWQGYAQTPPTHNRGGLFDFYLQRPPDGVKSHACWHHAGKGWFWVNFHAPYPDLLSGIKFIENFLAQVTGNRP